MKSFIKTTLAKSVQNETVWRMLNASLFRLTRFLEREKNRNENSPPPPVLNFEEALKIISPDLTVRHGVFKGLKYPVKQSVGSVLIPKLLGSYEQELQPLLQRLKARNYSEIVDIGCAEGYFAIGLGRLFPATKIFAYDTNPEGVRLCRLMAQVNQVENRLVTGSFCDAAALQKLPLTRRALVVSDCEGYEKSLFTPETVRKLANHDVLIEVHDFVDLAISSKLRAVFEATHHLEIITSIDDVKKAQTYDYPELATFDLAQRKILLAEHRVSIMEWFYFSPRTISYIPE
jgi:SAM-dependent methyltransferase